MKVYSMYEGLSKWAYWESPNSCYRHFVEAGCITLETLGDTLCIL